MNTTHNRIVDARLGLATLGLALFAAIAPAQAVPVIVVGSHNLVADTAHQPVAIRVSGVQDVGMLNLNAQIEDGTGSGRPVFDGVDLLTGTIFEGNHLAPVDTGSSPRIATWSVVTASGTVSANEGLLATLYVDTTGVDSGTYSLSLGTTLNGATTFYDEAGLTEIPITITDGTVSVPEPASLGFVGVGVMLILRRRQ